MIDFTRADKNDVSSGFWSSHDAKPVAHVGQGSPVGPKERIPGRPPKSRVTRNDVTDERSTHRA